MSSKPEPATVCFPGLGLCFSARAIKALGKRGSTDLAGDQSDRQRPLLKKNDRFGLKDELKACICFTPSCVG